ncbi:hypothetical protein ACLB2K_013831 [Fragaria x ananassa]
MLEARSFKQFDLSRQFGVYKNQTGSARLRPTTSSFCSGGAPIAPPSSGRLSAQDWCPKLRIVVPDLKMVFDFNEKLQREGDSNERRIFRFVSDISILAKSRSLTGVDSFVSVSSMFLGLQLVETSSDEGESKRRSF